jgi:hypothetical protein
MAHTWKAPIMICTNNVTSLLIQEVKLLTLWNCITCISLPSLSYHNVSRLPKFKHALRKFVVSGLNTLTHSCFLPVF